MGTRPSVSNLRGRGHIRSAASRMDRTTPSCSSSLLDLSWRHLMLEPFARLPDRVRFTLVRRGRIPGLRTAKATLAVVAAYLLAEVLHLSEHPIVAPLMALFFTALTAAWTAITSSGVVASAIPSSMR